MYLKPLERKILWKFKLSILRRFCGLLNKCLGLNILKERWQWNSEPFNPWELADRILWTKVIDTWTKLRVHKGHCLPQSSLPEPLWEFHKLVILVNISEKKPEFEWYKTRTSHTSFLWYPQSILNVKRNSLAQPMLFCCHPKYFTIFYKHEKLP